MCDMNHGNEKMKKRRIIIPSLSILAVASMAGSLAGTIAWYQYSTRATASVAGTDASTYGNLQLAFGYFKEETDGQKFGFKSDSITDPSDKAIWKTDAGTEALANYISSYRKEELAVTEDANVQEFKPVTARLNDDGSIDKFYSHPVYQYNELSSWNEASFTDYITFPLTLRLASNTTAESGYPVYLQDLRLQSTDSLLSKALRVEYSSQAFVKDSTDESKFVKSGTVTNVLLSEEGGETYTYGPLDLNGDGVFDSEKFTYDFDKKNVITYGQDGSKQNSVKQADIAAKDDGKGKLTAKETTKSLGTIPQDGYLQVNVTIWLEGWHVFSGTEENLKNPLTILKNKESTAKKALNSALTDYNSDKQDDKKKAFEDALAEYKEAFEDYMTGVDALPSVKEALKKADAADFKIAKEAFVNEVKALTVDNFNDKNSLDAALTKKVAYDNAKTLLGIDALVTNVMKESSLWDTEYIGKQFNVGMTFAVSNF